MEELRILELRDRRLTVAVSAVVPQLVLRVYRWLAGSGSPRAQQHAAERVSGLDESWQLVDLARDCSVEV